MTESPEVIFLSASDNKSKIGKVMATIREHYVKGERVLVRMADENAAMFLDEHLWSVPAESFLPHEFTSEKSRERVIITTSDRNLNDATVLIHLCQEASEMPLRFRTLYDLKDATSEERLQASRDRYRAYQKRGFKIEIR